MTLEEHTLSDPATGYTRLVRLQRGWTAVDVLRHAGGTVHYHQFAGGHSVKQWRKDLAEALPLLLT